MRWRRIPEAAVACAKLLDYSHRELLDGAGDDYSWGGRAKRRGKGMRDTHQYDEPQEVFSACAAAAVYRRTALDEVGSFDERFFFNYEDVDWCFRAQLAGWSCRYVPTAVAYHLVSATLRSAARDFKLYHDWRNAIWVVAKNYPGGRSCAMRPSCSPCRFAIWSAPHACGASRCGCAYGVTPSPDCPPCLPTGAGSRLREPSRWRSSTG